MAEGDTDHHSSGSSHLSSVPSLMSENAENMDTEVEYPFCGWNEDTDINWQERCLELELSLQKFRDQASKIRALLQEKEGLVNGLYQKSSTEGNLVNCQNMLEDLEHRVIEAEERADEAESKVRMMEQKLSESKWTPSETHDRYHQLQNAVKEKDRIINQLETQVEEQKQLRVKDAKQVEAKAARIKQWVTNKLKELEEQNLHLQEQNQKCNQQLELLRNRFHHLPSSQLNTRSSSKDGEKAERVSTEDSSRGSFEEHGDSEENLPRQFTASNVIAQQVESSSSDSTQASSTIFEQGDSDSDHACAEISSTKKKGATKHGTPPRIKIERKKYQDNHVSMLSSTPSSEGESVPSKSRDSRVDSGSVDLETPLSLTPKSPLTPLTPHLPSVPSNSAATRQCSDLSASVRKSKSDMKKKPVPPPRSRVPKRMEAASASHLNNEESGRSSPSAESEMYDSFVEEIISSLNCNNRATQGVNLRLPRSSDDDEMHDYAEIYTPSKERGPQWNNENHQDNKPPTPPLHRFPSWESRIYEIASNGMTLSDTVIDGAQADSTISIKNCGTYANGAHPYCEISVPVYATVKGRASQIRSFPFTGDSSDSSDNEDVRVTMTTNSSHTTSGETDSSLSTSSPSKSLKTASSPSPAKQSSSSPTKCVKRTDVTKDFCNLDIIPPFDSSVENALTDDYAIPPDAISSDALSIDSSIEPRLIKSGSQDSPKKESLEKSGYLTKLGGKLKTWRKRWFVLKNGTLTYYKSQNDTSRKAQGQITLDEVCRVTRAEGSATFEITTDKKTYYLTAESTATMEEWVRVLQNVLRRNATKLLLGKDENKSTIQAWLVKVKHGHSKRCWCILVGKMFLYFKTPNDMTPIGQINMRDARVEEVEHVSDSDEDEDRETIDSAKREGEFTIGIFPNHQGPTYLLFPSKQEKDTWLYHLTVVSSGASNVGTQYEQLIQRLMEMDGDPNCVIWKHPILLYSKESISHPLTTLPSEQLQTEAVKLFKSCQLFMSVLLDSAGIDYHVVLAQNALQQCLNTPELQNEFFCQLIKQTSRHTQQKIGMQQLLLCATQSLFLCDSSGSEKTSPTSNVAERLPPPPDCKMNPANFVFIQGWQLLALAISLFLPKNNRLLWYLKLHLERNADPKTEIGKYAIFCQRALERSKQNGGRESKPSRMEVLSILLKNPYHHSLPHSIPVHFLNGTYQVVGFDGSSTLEEFIQTLNQEIGVRDTAYSGFALFSDDPIDKSLEHYLQADVKLADVISKWETALRENKLGKFENTKVVKLTYKNRLYFKNYMKSETEKERLLMLYQTNEDIFQGRFPVSKELALELSALLAQIEFGDYNAERGGRGSGGTPASPQHQVQHVLEKFYPRRYKEGLSTEEFKQLTESVIDKWQSLRGRTLLDCVRIYLTCVRKWPYFGAKLFSARLKTTDQSAIWLAVSDDSISMLEYSTMQPLRRFPYPSLVTFGGCRDDFMLVVSQSDADGGRLEPTTEKFLFIMNKPQILELTLLTADYTNALNRPHVPPPTPQTGSLSRPESRLRSKQHCARVEPDLVKMATEAENKLQRSDSKKQRGAVTGGAAGGGLGAISDVV